MILEGNFMPVSDTMSSPIAKQPNIIKNCRAISVCAILSFYNVKIYLLLDYSAKLRFFNEATNILIRYVP